MVSEPLDFAKDPRNRKTLNGLKATTPVKAPADTAFGIEIYLNDLDLQAIVAGLMASAAHGLGDLKAAEVVVKTLWRRRAARSHGKQVLASTQRASALTKFETGVDFYVYVAADYARALGITHWQLEAALFHELCSLAVDTDTEGNTSLSSRGHDAEVFIEELKYYGPWMVGLADVSEAFKQAPLFGDIVATFDRQRAADKEANPDE